MSIPVLSIKRINDKIINAINNFIMVTEFSFFGEFSLFVNFRESPSMPTMGVYVNTNGMHCMYNNEWINKLSDGEFCFVLIHELFHLLCDHVQRGRSLNHEAKLSNYACDMIVNSAIREEYSQTTYQFMNIDIKIEDPKGDEKGVFIPKEYEKTGLEKIYEVLYDWLHKKRDQYQEWKNQQQQQGQGQGHQEPQVVGPQGQGQGKKKSGGDYDENGNSKTNHKNDGCPVSDELREVFDNLETYKFDEHMIDDLDPDVRKQIIEDYYNNLKSRGLISSTMEKILDRLRRSRQNYIEEFKKQVSLMMGIYKYKTFLRPNRRGIEGLKGKRKKAKIINCLLDTSGSMYGLIEKVLSFIFQDNIIINMIQCDAEVKDFKVVKNKKELQKLNIYGLGGTVLQLGLEFIKSNRVLNVNNTVILTDGYCDKLNTQGMKKILILTCGDIVDIIGSDNNVKQIIVDKDIK